MAGTQADAATTELLEWYSKLFSRRVDIVGDYAGNELFLIEGDSVLLHSLSDKHVNFDPGFQLLHAAYAVESFLRGLVARRCNFHLAFFDDHSELCVPAHVPEGNREKYLLARAAIIRHLRVNLKSVHPDIEIHVFPSVSSGEFAEYIAATDLYFIMCHDGALPGTFRKRSMLSQQQLDELDEEEEDEEKENELRAKVAFRLLIWWFLDRGYNAALVNGLEWRDTKVMTTILDKMHHTKPGHFAHMITASGSPTTEPPAVSKSKDTLAQIKSSMSTPLTERECLTVLILSNLGNENGRLSQYASAFLRHTALLSQLALNDRILDAEPLDEPAEEFLDNFTTRARLLLHFDVFSQDTLEASLQCDVADLVDGSLFSACLHDSKCGMGTRYQLLLDTLSRLRGAEIATTSSNGSLSASKVAPKTPAANLDSRAYAVLPFSNSVFEKHLAPIELAVDKSDDVIDSTSARIFRESTYWHNSKRPIDPKIREEQILKNQKQQFYARRRNQWFMAEMMAYAASLTNAVGKTLEPEIITTGGKGKSTALPPVEKKEEVAKPKANQKGGKKQVMSKKQAMMAEIAANRSKKEEATSEKLVQGWRTACAGLEQEAVLAAKYQKTRQYLTTLNTDLKREVLEAEVRLYLLNILLVMWIEYCRSNKKEEGLHLAALIFDSTNSFSKLKYDITKQIAESLTSTIKLMKLPQVKVPTPNGDRILAFTFALKSAPALDLSIPASAIQFQLDHCGPYFERSIDSAPDPRVPFEPDAWQRKVLDEIDAKRSLLVIAPTSAGKTFISFYAMQQVLESNDDDILVYVAPTKALVNQIAAEVQARFSKTYKFAGNSVWGIHTRDMRINNPTGCQILVTVPHILQIMLLAPSNAKSWSERVKWIIFDEVHSIGQAEDGLIWEQLLLLAPCPIIALSATIGNAKEFNAWLTSTQKAIGNNLQMVQHPHRYSDLRKFVYAPPKSFKFEGLSENRAFAKLGLDDSRDFTFVHPVATLANRTRGIPDDFSLEARDCYTLWQSMKKHQTSEYPVDKSLDPVSALPAVVTKRDTIKWEADLKAILRKWIADNESPFKAVYDDFNRDLVTYETRIQEEANEEDKEPKRDSGAEEDEEEDEFDDGHSADKILALLNTLHEQDALPGIVFNYDRGVCEKILRTLLNQLVDAEASWKEHSPKWKKMLESWETWKKAMAKVDKRKPPKSIKKGGKGDDEVLTKADLMKDAASSEASPWASFDPENPVEGFHFADHKKGSQEELAKYMKELIRREVPQWLLDGLKRGIGVHHAGMNRKYRQVVEIFFRKGYLRVVVATGTLALGINMPCKTVIFSGDSVFLTALNYRQAAGRAGRRGFDMLGNVVFHGVSTNKIRRLMSSRLPDLNGHFPITTTLVLRLFTLLNESKDSPFAIRSINALLSQPRLYLGGEESKMTVLHHLRFSIEYLRRQFLLDSRGAPLNFSGCVSHLYFAENSAFAFHSLLKDGYFHELCSNIEKDQETTLKELMLTMAHLFGRQYCRQADQEFIEEVVKKSQSMVFLPPMPKNAANVLRAHNESTLGIFKAYVQTFVQQNITHPDDTLPLTQMKVGGDSSESGQTLPRRAPPTVRSSFVALSGHDDKFDSIHDLCQTARSGVFLEEAVVPSVGLYPDDSDLPLNAYLYDYFIHGDVTTLVKVNRIRQGDVWFILNDFSMVLATIVTSLSTFMNLTPASDLDFTDVRGEGDEAEEAKEDELLPSDSGYETASTLSYATNQADQGQQKGLPVQVKKKKKVVDSWDDEADEEDFQDELQAEKEKKARQKELEDMDKPAWEEGAGLPKVLKAFKLLREDFDTKFRAMWA